MKKYYVSIPIYASATYVIMAESEEAAINKAYEERGLPTICHQCPDEIDVCDFCEDGAVAEEIE